MQPETLSRSTLSRRISPASKKIPRRELWYSRLVCKRCGSGYRMRKRTVRLRWGLARFVFQEVPILACTGCRSTLYFPEVLRKLERKMRGYLRRTDVAEFRYGS